MVTLQNLLEDAQRDYWEGWKVSDPKVRTGNCFTAAVRRALTGKGAFCLLLATDRLNPHFFSRDLQRGLKFDIRPHYTSKIKYLGAPFKRPSLLWLLWYPYQDVERVDTDA